jgi:hypothetical protein
MAISILIEAAERLACPKWTPESDGPTRLLLASA